jgi:dephospho-CoA kinase
MFPNLPIPLIGLTGQTGAGKSTAAGILAGLGCGVIDGDALAREAVLPGSPVLAALAQRFGHDIINSDGTLNRGLLASRAFADETARRALNAITHPAITALAAQRAEALCGSRAIVVDAAALLESALAALCDHIIVITAPEALRLRRILARDGLTPEAAQTRVRAQRKMDYHGHTIIENTESEAALRHEMEQTLALVLAAFADGGVAAGRIAEAAD